MATYKEIQGYVKETYGFLPKTCWIAHMKELCGIPVKNAPNRISPSHREKLVPLKKCRTSKKRSGIWNDIKKKRAI